MTYSEKAQYHHCRQEDTKKFKCPRKKKGCMKTIPMSHTPEGKNGQFPLKRAKKDVKAIIGTLKKTNKPAIQSVLIPKKKNEKVNWIQNPNKDKKGEKKIDEFCLMYS